MHYYLAVSRGELGRCEFGLMFMSLHTVPASYPRFQHYQSLNKDLKRSEQRRRNQNCCVSLFCPSLSFG